MKHQNNPLSFIKKFARANRRNGHAAAVHRPFSLLADAGDRLLAGDALLSVTVLETHYSPNRSHPVAIVGIVIVQCPTVACVANPDIVGVARVGRPQPITTRPRGRCSLSPMLFSFLKILFVLLFVGLKPRFHKVLRGCH